MDPEVPLVVPEVNAKAIAGYKTKNIIANPNCSTIQMVVALAPLHAKAGLNRVTVSTYQAVSGAGREAMDELREQVGLLFRGEDIEPSISPPDCIQRNPADRCAKRRWLHQRRMEDGLRNPQDHGPSRARHHANLRSSTCI